MSGKHNNAIVKRVIDVCMTVTLLFLMAYQVTGEFLHEWIGMGMTLLVIIHQILNRKWYSAVFKGKYNPYRILTTLINLLLIVSFVLTAISGMAMSGHAVPFLYGIINVYYSKLLHISMSQWSFVFMGLHLGLHIPVMAAKLKFTNSQKKAISAVCCLIAGIGLFLFIRNGMFDYMLWRSVFATFDYSKSGALVLLENVVMLLFWVFTGTQMSTLCRKAFGKTKQKNQLLPILFIIAAVIIGLVLYMILG